MARPHIEVFDGLQAGSSGVEEGPLAGTRATPLSHDEETGADSLLVLAAAGTTIGPLGDRAWDVFVVQGALRVAGEEIGSEGYLYVPGVQEAHAEVLADSVLFIGRSPEGTPREGGIQIVHPEQQDWQYRFRENLDAARFGRSVNIVKFFRVDAEYGESIGISTMPPGSGIDCTERHEPVDEVLVLRGSMLVPDLDGTPAELGPGYYQWRPPNVPHLPKYTFDGCVTFFRTLEGGWDCEVLYENDPHWSDTASEYRERRLRALWSPSAG